MRLSASEFIPKLTDSMTDILSDIVSSRMMPACIIQRAKIILYSAQNKQNKEIAADVGLHVNNVGKWRTRFINEINRLKTVESDDPGKLEAEIISVLYDRQRSGASQTFTADQRTYIVTIACHRPQDYGFELSHWSLSALRRAIIDKNIVQDISVSSISRILNENKIHPHKVQYWLHSSEKTDNPETYKAKVRAVNQTYELAHKLSKSNEENSIHILSTDEMTGIQALEHKYPDKLPSKGMTALQEFEYIRHGTISLTAFLDVVTGKIMDPYLNSTRNEEDFVAALDKVIKTDPDKEWIIIADNLNTHYSASLVEYIAGQIDYTDDLGKKGKSGILQSKSSRIEFLTNSNHRIRFIYTPKHCSWLNQIEIWFGIISKQLLKRKSYKSVDELIESIKKFIDQYNALFAHPFNWKYNTTPLD